MASYAAASEALAQQQNQNANAVPQGRWADKYRGVGALSPIAKRWANKTEQATVEDLDPPPALSVSPKDTVSSALLTSYERDYTHLTVISSTRSLLGYLNIPLLKQHLHEGAVHETNTVSSAMQRFHRKRGTYRVITMQTPLEELEEFFESEVGGNGERREKQEFAVVTDALRKFVLGVATRGDLEEFVKRRPT